MAPENALEMHRAVVPPPASGAGDDERRTVREPVGLVEAEDGQVAERAERALGRRGEPCLRSVLDEEEVALVAPTTPAADVLGEAEVVDEIEGACTRRENRTE